jgi:hypothetical protein
MQIKSIIRTVRLVHSHPLMITIQVKKKPFYKYLLVILLV